MMKQTIEALWKTGFVNDQALIAPQINDLYNQKSQNLVDRFQQMFAMNLKGIVVGAVLILIVLVWKGYPYLAISIDLLLLWAVVVGRNNRHQLYAIDKNASSYDYLKAFENWIDVVIGQYIKVYRIIYPLLFLSILIQGRFTESGERLVKALLLDFPETTLLVGTPWFLVAGVMLVAGLISAFTGPIYRFDLYLMYGRELQKLKDLIADMESLRDSDS